MMDAIKPSLPACLGCQSHNHSQLLKYRSPFPHLSLHALGVDCTFDTAIEEEKIFGGGITLHHIKAQVSDELIHMKRCRA